MQHSEFGAPRSIFDVREKLREMGPATRRPFGKVEALVSLILVCPVTSCEAERSFSALCIVPPPPRFFVCYTFVIEGIISRFGDVS